MKDNQGISDITRERLLDAAETVFAKKGYPSASVRDITGAAGCNVASVNYHFGSKKGLYREVFKRRLGELRDLRISAIAGIMEEPGADRTLERLLEAWRKNPSAVVTAGWNGQFGPPVIFPARLFRELEMLRGERGAKSLVSAQHQYTTVDMLNAKYDLDTPGDLEDLRSMVDSGSA